MLKLVLTVYTEHQLDVWCCFVKSSWLKNLWNQHQNKQFCFYRHILIDCLEVEESQASSQSCSMEILYKNIITRQVTVKPFIHTGFSTDIFLQLDLFATI